MLSEILLELANKFEQYNDPDVKRDEDSGKE
jgi:hypothetical protein